MNSLSQRTSHSNILNPVTVFLVPPVFYEGVFKPKDTGANFNLANEVVDMVNM